MFTYYLNSANAGSEQAELLHINFSSQSIAFSGRSFEVEVVKNFLTHWMAQKYAHFATKQLNDDCNWQKRASCIANQTTQTTSSIISLNSELH